MYNVQFPLEVLLPGRLPGRSTRASGKPSGSPHWDLPQRGGDAEPNLEAALRHTGRDQGKPRDETQAAGSAEGYEQITQSAPANIPADISLC